MGVPPPPTPPPGPQRAYEVEWTTISYRAIALYALLVLVALGVILYLIAPTFFSQQAKRALAAISAGLGQDIGTNVGTSKREAHFVNIDGTVRVKKAQSLQWMRADYNTNLEKGDYVQTGSDGVARIIFADGTNYMLKPDSLIVVEESREDPVTKATRVAVQVSSGTVDLSTGRFDVPGSTSRVSFENAVANLAQESRAVVRNDPKQNVHEFTVQEGQASVTRGSTTVRLGTYDQVSFRAEEPGLARRRVIAPPTLANPPNMALTMTKEPKTTNLDFGWKAVPGAVAYRLQISPSGLFSNLVVDKKVTGKTSTTVSGLEEGTYYWVVTSFDGEGMESQPSAANRFSLVQQLDTGTKVFLEVSGIVQHGRVLEIVGRTEPGSTVIINNEQVFSIAPDGTFRHFTSQLARAGANQITVTAQNRRGDIHTVRKNVVVE
jgi:hypothetical protein